MTAAIPNLVLCDFPADTGHEASKGAHRKPRLSVADLGLFAQLHALRLPQTPWRAEDLARRARLTRWLDRVDAATRA